jgi:hypothetical protein
MDPALPAEVLASLGPPLAETDDFDSPVAVLKELQRHGLENGYCVIKGDQYPPPKVCESKGVQPNYFVYICAKSRASTTTL